MDRLICPFMIHELVADERKIGVQRASSDSAACRSFGGEDPNSQRSQIKPAQPRLHMLALETLQLRLPARDMLRSVSRQSPDQKRSRRSNSRRIRHTQPET